MYQKTLALGQFLTPKAPVKIPKQVLVHSLSTKRLAT